MARRKKSYYCRKKKALAKILRAGKLQKRIASHAVSPKQHESLIIQCESTGIVASDNDVTSTRNDFPTVTPTKVSDGIDIYEFVPDCEIPIKEIPIRNRPHTSSHNEYENSDNIHLEGRRIVDINYVLSQILSDRHTGGTGCTFMDCKFQREFRDGFACTWIFKCAVCNVETEIRSEKKSSTDMGVNDAVVTGVISSGNGFVALSEIAAAMNIPCIASNTYIRHERKISRAIDNAALSSMLEAGKEEKALAEKDGCLDVDGTPMIALIADGMWGKRSYKTKYDAMSGTASIVGARTNKVLFLGMRNRNCSICSFADRKGTKATEHECYKNWKKSATSMEADIVAEGFKCSVDMHGLKYHQIISDGDSSVHRKLLETLPYGPQRLVEKIECKNHLLRNYSKSLTALCRDTKSGYPVRVRKEVADSCLKLVTAVSKASLHRQKETGLLGDRIASLKSDIINSPSHVFGRHTRCDPYFCKSLGTNEPNLIIELEKCGLWSQIQRLVDNLSNHARSLIHNKNNNKCEVLNSVTAKFLTGKRINYSSRSSFNARCSSAVVSMNSSGQFQTSVHKSVQNGKSPGKFTKLFETRKLRKLQYNRKRRLMFPKKRKIAVANGPDEDYGLIDVEDDQCQEELEDLKRNFLESLKLSQDDRDTLQQATDKQMCSPLWMSERRLRLSSSHHGAVCHMKPTTSCKNQVFNILYGSTLTKSMRHGIEMEPEAKKVLKEKYNLEVLPCGLFIDSEYPYLSATPDGLVSNDAVVEVKCPTSAGAFSTAKEAISAGKLPYLKVNDEGSIILKKDANYHYQVQSQLHITNRRICHFFVYTSKWEILLQIEADPDFWRDKMAKKLQEFYMDCLLPELASPRYGKRFCKDDIREAEKILKAQEEAKLKIRSKKRKIE